MSVRWVFNDIPKLPRRLQSGTHEALKQVGDALLTRANANTPVRSGRLRSGNRVKIGPFPSRTVTVSNDTPYAVFVEFGTSRMAPRLFLTRALNETEPEYRSLLAQVVAAKMAGR